MTIDLSREEQRQRVHDLDAVTIDLEPEPANPAARRTSKGGPSGSARAQPAAKAAEVGASEQQRMNQAQEAEKRSREHTGDDGAAKRPRASEGVGSSRDAGPSTAPAGSAARMQVQAESSLEQLRHRGPASQGEQYAPPRPGAGLPAAAADGAPRTAGRAAAGTAAGKQPTPAATASPAAGKQPTAGCGHAAAATTAVSLGALREPTIGAYAKALEEMEEAGRRAVAEAFANLELERAAL